MMAAVGTGLFPSLQDAAREFVQMERVFKPNPKENERHENNFIQYQLLYRQLIPFNAER